ncbi:hypothetical protein GGS23DRAFT_606811 [Durotheca rogersii]|uniref:uncharacterized protein n=1 Tax=Durotheca rogersii TaxID=419775 RepID=UPI00221E6143|nr:uncharacterized protein GGS23DRAFT_606811 [Durotheca rogersii]KAI5860539.1 hypothetical protein GGS23DRAFT_606811 [Durotheca rogersii]
MAANMPQMGGGGHVRRPPQQQLSQFVYTQMMQNAVQTNGWQDQVQVNLRVSNAMNLITNSFLAMPTVDSQQLVSHGLTFERDAFISSQDKAKLFKRRQAHEQSLQSSLNAQAAAQAQAQMLMNQNMQMSRGMGQPPQAGFPHLQQPMQASPMPQQPHPPGMGMANPGGLPMNPNQQAMQVGAAQMRPQLSIHATMASLSPQDRAKVSQLAAARLNQTPEPQRNQLRMILQQKLGAQQLAQLQQDGVDPVLSYFQSQILQNSKGQAAAGIGNNQAAMQMQAQQRQMSQPGQQMAAAPNSEFGPFSNVESIMNQQKAGMLAQEAGQMVVPASNGPGRNATPQPLGGVQGPNPGNHPGPNQAGNPRQIPQQFTHPQAQQLKMDQMAAQTQAQIRAQAQAKQVQGQPGGLNGAGAISQSPGINTLNTPVRRTPIGMGQAEGQAQMNQTGGPFGQGLDPRFNHGNQRPQMTGIAALSSVNRQHLMNAMLSQMPPESRQLFLSLPRDKADDMMAKWLSNQNKAAGQMPGRGQPLPGQFGQGNPMAQFNPGNNGGQQPPNPGMPMNQNQMLLQQQLNRMRAMSGQNRPPMTSDLAATMDSMDVPPKVMMSLRNPNYFPGLPQEIKKWIQLKQWISQRNVDSRVLSQLQHAQNYQLQALLKQNPGGAGNQMSQPNMSPQGPQPQGSQMGIVVTPQELQTAKNHERFKGIPDETIKKMLMQMKMKAKANAQAMNHMQTAQASQPANANVPAAIQPPNALNISQQRQQNPGLDVNGANFAASARNTRQPPNNRPPQIAPPAAPQKNSLKRASTDDLEAPSPSSNPAQRSLSQQAQASAPGSAAQQVQLSHQQLEQRLRYEAMAKRSQAGTGGANGNNGQPLSLSEEMQRLKAIGQEEHQNASKETFPDIPMSPEQYQDMAQKIQSIVGEMGKLSKILGRWYSLMRLRLIRQFVDGDKMSVLKPAFSVRPKDLDGVRGMLESMAKDVATQYPQALRKNPNPQQSVTESSGPQQGTTEHTVTPPTNQTAPSNAANAEKQPQTLGKTHQRTSSRGGQPPAAPTTSQPPFSFGAQSPNGQPTYIGKPTVTQADLHLPARKKPRTGQSGLGSGGASASSSPQVQKMPSPDMVKRPAPTEVKAPPKLQYYCPELNCEAHGIGFATEEAQRNHIEEEHVKPSRNPVKYATENLANLLGLDSNGKVKAQPKTPATAPGAPPSASPMANDASKQGQTPSSRAEAMPMSREPSMKRQGSAAGSRPTDLAKSLGGRAGTPKTDAGTKGGENAAAAAKAEEGISSQAPGANNNWALTVDPQDLFQKLGGLEGGGGGAISDMNVYRAITPNDTPESIKDSASSEPNSDLSDGVTLNMTLDMGFDSWQPFDKGQNADFDPIDVDMDGVNSGENAQGIFSWDDIMQNFQQPFALDTSLYSLDTT